MIGLINMIGKQLQVYCAIEYLFVDLVEEESVVSLRAYPASSLIWTNEQLPLMSLDEMSIQCKLYLMI